MYPGYSTTLHPPYAASNELLSLYDKAPQADTSVYLGDLRSRIYINIQAFLDFATFTFDYKFLGGSDGVGGAGIRTAEVYLNRAEANIHQYLASGNAALRQAALSDINTLRANRYDSRKIYIPIAITDGNELLTFYKNERRREFPFDGEHRWFDLRRYGMPQLTHTYSEAPASSQTFTLAKGDNRYTLPIPEVVLSRNAQLSQNP
ncbi:RagB/SusD family nutrient uptake outer membrane protein [Niabella hibiscisoli]|uniref:RagB/SusD family nutrient uptake outer membrane protein n=1 Tax=Niabella hibiscisoli TaxID=1825928 RepID=UPI001F0FE3CD|nr:RagB/SusD family nutrient uptake outer membrane protein [Niabella hibiscisoli]MCH5721104.1 RagB/SusD family nutrient uptake outer membrane protein [Niabella hibiscisoli]